jgi:hypothetical protein
MVLHVAAVQIDAPIVPNQGLSGIALRARMADLRELLEATYIRNLPRSDWYELASPWEARYRLGPVEIAVDVRNGKVFKVTARSGYVGKLFGKIGVGMPVGEAMKLEPRLYYDEAEEIVLVRGCPGITIDVPEIDPDPALVPSYPIHAISAMAPEAFTADGQLGNW